MTELIIAVLVVTAVAAYVAAISALVASEFGTRSSRNAHHRTRGKRP